MASCRLCKPILLRYDFGLGPPGTGKTQTICAAASIWDSQSIPAWIVAHSNVAVLNIAEVLHERQVDFKLLVSKEFHFEWCALTLCSS